MRALVTQRGSLERPFILTVPRRDTAARTRPRRYTSPCGGVTLSYDTSLFRERDNRAKTLLLINSEVSPRPRLEISPFLAKGVSTATGLFL